MSKADTRRLVYGLVSQGCSEAAVVAMQANTHLLRTSRPSLLGLTRFCYSSVSSAAGRIARRFAC